MSTLTFVIPIRHPDGVRDKPLQQRVLAQTFAAIAAQTHPGWRARVVCNPSQRLPALPPGFEVVPVDFPTVHETLENPGDLKTFINAISIDKGRRVEAALHDLGPRDRIMVHDDDDLVSRRLAGFIADRPTHEGWFVDRGWSWMDGARVVRRLPELWRECGTCIIAPLDRYLAFSDPAAPRDAALYDLGDHMDVKQRHEGRDTAFLPLPFRAAVSRKGHSFASQDLLLRHGFRPFLHNHGPRRRSSHPLRGWGAWARSYLQERPLDPWLRREFFGGASGPFKAAPGDAAYRRVGA